MEAPELNVVTGAFGYTGKYISQRLLSMGKRVTTLTGHPNRQHSFGDQVTVAPFNFDSQLDLTKSLEGATTLYNTYWVRFPYREVTFDSAVENTKTLIKAAEDAGVRRIVHISVTNAAEDSPLPYFRGKGLQEKAIIQSNLAYAIIRPTEIFGAEDVLLGNIAWLLRRLPVFAIFGSGDYHLQPVFVEDVAELAVRAAHQHENVIIDAAGPETFTYNGLVRLIADAVGSRARIMHLPPELALLVARLVGYIVRDAIVTRDEMRGLMSSLLVSDGPLTGQTHLRDWLEKNAHLLGVRYASELDQHYR